MARVEQRDSLAISFWLGFRNNRSRDKLCRSGEFLILYDYMCIKHVASWLSLHFNATHDYRKSFTDCRARAAGQYTAVLRLFPNFDEDGGQLARCRTHPVLE